MNPRPSGERYTVVDLFSGAGGFSYGFKSHPAFQVIAAVDAQIGKPSDGASQLECNSTYRANMGIEPLELDLSRVPAPELVDTLRQCTGVASPDVLIVCPPCTGLTRNVPRNHVHDDPRNDLIDRSVEFVEALKPRLMLMENARELILGKFAHHYQRVREGLERQGYRVHGEVRRFDQLGLPQRRERAIVIAAREGLTLRTLGELWSGWRVRDEATTVRRAIFDRAPLQAGEVSPTDPTDFAPCLGSARTLARLEAVPADGGSWSDLLGTEHEHLLIPSMIAARDRGALNNHGDVYGRMWWDRPSPTIKRECAHVGNGRYSHPVQNRLCSAREMAILQGFPASFRFDSRRRNNIYRHIGNAVPPLVAYQLAWVCHWTLTGQRPSRSQIVLPGCHLRSDDIVECPKENESRGF